MLTSEKKQYGSESCHAYDREGNPQHSVPYKDKKRKGEMRPTTLRDIKERGWLPSVSAILGVVEKKGLDGWKKEQVAKAAFAIQLEAPYKDEVFFIQDVLELAEAKMTKARDLGTEIHGAIEQWLRNLSGVRDHENFMPDGFTHYLHVKAAVNALRELGVWGQPFSAERTFASPLGFGGTKDFETLSLIADFKCVDRLDKKLAYDDRCAQLCAYSAGSLSLDKINELRRFSDESYMVTNKQLVNIFISTSEPGKYLIHEWSTEDKEHGWALFKACFELYKIVNRYDPLNL